MTYTDFLSTKRLIIPGAGIVDGYMLSDRLFPFQRDLVTWALRRGRAALFCECGLGKGWMALEWARIVSEHAGRVLVIAPLAVAQQFQREAAKLGVPVTICRESSDVADGINVTNYERFERLDPGMFAGVVLDESSILKNYSGSTRNALVDAWKATPFRLACTATPAPNDHMELGNHAEFLGVMSRVEMLSRFFVHDGGETQKWRLKGHAVEEFWKWVSGWSANVKRPSDLGYSDAGYDLPPLNMHHHVVPIDAAMVRAAGLLFAAEVKTLAEQRAYRKASLTDRVRIAADLANASTDPWLIWCDLNDESSELTKAIDGAVEIKGADAPERKESAMLDFIEGRSRVLVSKPSICGWGVNLQHCANTAFVGVSHSFELWYQAIRRVWRFGQTRPVECHVVTSEADGAVVQNLERKARDFDAMADGTLKFVRELTRAAVRATERDFDDYLPLTKMRVPEWLRSESV